MNKYSVAFRLFTSCGGIRKNIFAGMSANFVNVFKSILKLVKFFASCEESEKISKTLMEGPQDLQLHSNGF